MRTMKYVAVIGLFVSAIVGATAGITPTVKGFIPNAGQWPSEVKYLCRTPGMDAWITTSGMVMDQYEVKGTSRRGHVLRMQWQGSDTQSNNVVGEPSMSTVSFLNEASRFSDAKNLQVMKNLRFVDVYPGVDVVYYLDDQNRLRYDLDVKSGVSADEIGFVITGDMGMTIEPNDVRLNTTMGGIVMTDLYAYVLGKKSLGIPASFTARSNGIAFSVPQRDAQAPLTIDPVVYGTYVGSADNDRVTAVKTTALGVYAGGWTTTIQFPTGEGAYQSENKGLFDAFVALMSSDLKTVRSYTYFGGGSDDKLTAMTISDEGLVCVTGTTESSNLPTTIGAVGQIYKGQIDVFIAKFTADLSELKYATYVGGNKDDIPTAIGVDQEGSIFICGSTTSNGGFPATLAHQSAPGGGIDGFLARISPTGGSFVFCTYYGKPGNEWFTAMVLDGGGFPYLTGATSSSDFETAPTPGRFASGRVPYDRTFNGGNTDAFLIKFFPDGTLSKRDDGTFSTFFGGNGDDEGRGIYVDAQGRPVVVGVTTSTNLPAVGTQQQTLVGRRDIFMAVLTDDGRGLQACTYYGGTGDDDVLGMIQEPSGNTGLLFGVTTSNDFPFKGDGTDTERRGPNDGFLAQINPNANTFATLVTGSGSDSVIAASFDAKGDLYYAMASTSGDLFTNTDSWQATRGEGSEGYVGKIAFGTVALVSPQGGERWCMGSNRTITWSTASMPAGQTYRIELSKDGGATWTDLASAATGLSYTWKPDVTLEARNGYKIRISTDRGHIQTSEAFSLVSPPAITAQPVPTSGCAGSPVSLTVTATGEGVKYQWRKAGQNISGATSASYSIPSLAAANAGNYDVVVSGLCTPNITSSQVAVSVAVATAITTQPTSKIIEEKKPLTLTVMATGSNLTYQWKKDGADIAGATTATYSIASVATSDAGKYRCIVTGGCGEATSEEANIEVTPTTGVNDDVVTQGGSTMQVLGPIPADDQLSVRLNLLAGGRADVRLLDARGAVALIHNLGDLAAGMSVVSLPTGSLSSGIYALEISVGGTVLRTMINVAH
ncbi:MAG: hypothetical protein EHM43_02880 [Ignavibacteriae bacterium]|nr:MAG: hypothetical protein EHM43_02880 [Ignavibacteriota bacterium]